MPSGLTTFVIFKLVHASKSGSSASQSAIRAMPDPLVKGFLNCGLITAPAIGCTLRNVGARWCSCWRVVTKPLNPLTLKPPCVFHEISRSKL